MGDEINVKKIKLGLEMLAKFRMGSEAKACKYWKDEKEKYAECVEKKKRT